MRKRLIRYSASQRHRSDESAESQDRSRPYRALVLARQQPGKQLKVILDLFRGKRASPLIAASDFRGQCAEGTARTWILAVRIAHIIVDKLVDDYLSDGHRKNPGAGCAFSALAPEIARSDKRTRALTSDQVKADLELLAGLLPGRDKRAARSRAILTFSALVGAMSLARAVSDEALSREIQNTVAELLKKSASGHKESKT